ncbi:MAG: ABC transporter substrate-binding protein [Methanosarcinales archaeon]|nr:ABC transporter substrate-binding protein [Methanosarcinales archaeon]
MKKILRIGHLSTFYHTSFILMGTGWLEDHLDVTVRWSMFGGGPAIVEAFSKSEVDIGYIGLPPVMMGIDRGVPIISVGGGHVEGTIMIGPPSTKSLEELGEDAAAVLEQFKGGIIGCPPSGSIHDVIIRDLIKTVGLTDSINVKNFSWADFIPDALADGEIDAAIGTPPLSVSAAQSSGARVLIPPSKLWPWNPSYGIIVSHDLLQKEPWLVEGFLRLHEEASNLIRDHPDRAAGLVSELVQVVDIDFIKQTYAISPKYCASLPREYIVSSMAFVPVLRNLDYIGKHLKENDIFDTSIIQKIHSEPPHYM